MTTTASTCTVRVYGYDEQAGREALLSEHGFTSEAEARQAEHDAVASGAGVVTFDATEEAQASEETAPVSPYVADPGSPTDAEIAAAIQRSLELGTLIDAGEWMERHAAELGRA